MIRPGPVDDLETGVCEGAAEFRDDFLCDIGVVAEAVGERPVQAQWGAGPVPEPVSRYGEFRFAVSELRSQRQVEHGLIPCDGRPSDPL